MKTFLKALLSLAVLIYAASPVNAAPPKPQEIRFGYQVALTQALFVVAKQQGLFEQEFKKDGIKLTYAKFLTGPPVIEAFAGGRLDIGMVGDQPAIQAKANNIDIKIVGIYSNSGKAYGLVLPTGSSVKTVKDLKGKKVGVTVGSLRHQVLIRALETVGLTAKDIKLINLTPSDIKTSIAQRNIDAGVVVEPFVSILEHEKTGYQLGDATELVPDYDAYSPIIVTSEFAAKYPDIVKRVLKVFIKAEKWAKQNPDKIVKLVAQESGLKEEIVAKALKKVKYDIRLTDKSLASIAGSISFLRENNIIRKDVDPKDIIDTSYLKSLGVQ